MLQALIFFFTLLLPAGLAKHWIVPDSLVSGVLVDYLMPSIWIQDLIAIAIIVFSIIQLRDCVLKVRYPVIPKLVSVILILISVVLSPIPLISAINFSRFLLAMSVGWIVYKKKDLHQPALYGLAGAVFWTTILALSQLINQGTAIGWWFLGEPIFTIGSGGVKKIFILGQNLVLPMATLPHANVMGAFGLLSFLILNQTEDKNLLQAAKWFSLVLIFLSFSLPVWLITLYFLIRKFRPTYVVLILSSFFIILLATSYRLQATSFHRRWNLVKHSLTMIRNYPFFGVGWGGFVKQLPPATFFQPVHNVFFLVLAELGLVGTSGLLLVVKKTFKTVDINSKYLLLITVYLLLFLFDHYFWTTTQGVYMLWVMIGLF